MRRETREKLKKLTKKVMAKKKLSETYRPDATAIVHQQYEWFHTDLGYSDQEALRQVRINMGVR